MQATKAYGLTAAEAERLTKEGKSNVMPKAHDGGVGQILKRNLFTLFNLLNIVLAALLVWVGSYRNMLFLGVVVSNALIGTIQELRAKRTHDRLSLLSEGKVSVYRDGAKTELMRGELVLGDVVTLARGDQVPADAEVLEGEAQADESLLTGESVAVAKAMGDTLYSGSFLTGGGVTARLTAVGADSYAGKLQMSARKVERGKSELMRNMNTIIRAVSIAIVPIGLLLLAKQYFFLKQPLEEAVVGTVASVLGMIPEGLILLTSMALAVGVVRLGQHKALVNELYGIESLARTGVVCMDKTGTLTNGDMSLAQAIPLDGVKPDDIADCVGALLFVTPDHTPTIDALLAAYPARDMGETLQSIPFSSEHKWSAMRCAKLGTVAMGAPERLLRGEALEQAGAMAAKGLRVIALVRGEAPLLDDALPEGLTPVALLCLRDTLRPRVRETVRYFGEQGVKLKVISGDSPLTVSRVALDAGLPEAEKFVDLSAVEGKPDYAALAREYTVFGRVSPEDKRELITALKADGCGVAMVGDGVNDIPALKAADCSIAMAGGSDAACRVSQITLLNADFEAMPAIVLEGRRVINNITRASSLFLVKNIFSCVLSLILLALPYAYPFAPIQLTLISSLTIGAPSFVLALQPSNERLRGRFLQTVIARALPGGLCVALLALAVMLAQGALGLDSDKVSTLCTLIAGYSGLVVLLKTCLPLDTLRLALVAVMTAALAACVVIMPKLFYLVPLNAADLWTLAVCAVLAPVLQFVLTKAVEALSHQKKDGGVNVWNN